MSEHRPEPPGGKSRFIAPAIIGAIVVLIVAAALLLRFSARKAGAPTPPAPAPPAVALPKIVSPPPPLTRDDLVASANEAAAAYAMGEASSVETAGLIGRKFSIKIPFGCDGPQASSSSAQTYVEYDVAHNALKLVARPTNWTTLPLVQALPNASKIESVEGFWIPRPWSASGACPPPRSGPLPATQTPPTAQSLGLATYFEAEASRAAQRGGRDYTFTRKIDDSAVATTSSEYNLVIEGHITGYSDGRALECWSETAEHRPICLFAVAFDRIAFEDATSREALSEWKE